MYRHLTPNIKSFSNIFASTIDKLSNSNITYYICGNINIDLLQINNSKILCYMNTLFSYGFNQYIQNTTHVVNDSSSSLLNQFLPK